MDVVVSHSSGDLALQDMNVVVIGNVFGFNHNPAGNRLVCSKWAVVENCELNARVRRAIVIDRQNITICSTKSFLDHTCTPGRPRYTCRDVFSYCSGGKCLNENLELLSPKSDAFFAQ